MTVWFRRIAIGLGVTVGALLVLGSLGVVLVVQHYESNLPSVVELKTGYRPPQVTRVLAWDGTQLANLFTERRTVIPLSRIPAHAKLAFLAAEDANFYEHQGLDYLGMLRALVSNLRAGKTRQGGSTITQQVVKNVLLEPERTYERKIRETILARRLEQHLSKDEIFNLYLNHIYLGHGRYGIEEAARYYFGKPAQELDLAQAALLAGLVAAPERFSPRHDSARALARRRYVLEQMLQKGFVTADLYYTSALNAPLRLAPAADAESELVPEIIPAVKKSLAEAGGAAAERGGFTVQTGIDPALEAAARQAVRDNLERYAKRQKLEPPFLAKKRKLWGALFQGIPKLNHIYVGEVKALDDAARTIDVRVGEVVGRVQLGQEQRYNAKQLTPSQFTAPGAVLRVSLTSELEVNGPPPLLRLELGPQSALVAIDVRTRRVLALIGNSEALMGGLDRATRAKRQPGSAFKPFLYSYALHSRRFTPASVLELPPKPDAGAGAPNRRISVRQAIAQSDNDASSFLFEQVGPGNVVQWAHTLGIQSELAPTPSLALGAYEVTPYELVNAFATFASGGIFGSSHLITRVIGPDSKQLPLPFEAPPRRVMEEDESYLTTSLLRSVIEVGTARAARQLDRPLAGKTGTTNDAKDAWFVGYSTDIVTGVWVGYDDALPLGWGESGAVTALPAWISFMRIAHQRRPRTEFARPAGIVSARVDPRTGLLSYAEQADAVDEEFLEGTAPSAVAPPPSEQLADAGINAASGPDTVPAALPEVPKADAGSGPTR
jgi:penicillin-binding protein 1A